MYAIRSYYGFEIGSGFEGTRMTGIAHNDPFVSGADGRPRTASRNNFV